MTKVESTPILSKLSKTLSGEDQYIHRRVWLLAKKLNWAKVSRDLRKIKHKLKINSKNLIFVCKTQKDHFIRGEFIRAKIEIVKERTQVKKIWQEGAIT